MSGSTHGRLEHALGPRGLGGGGGGLEEMLGNLLGGGAGAGQGQIRSQAAGRAGGQGGGLGDMLGSLLGGGSGGGASTAKMGGIGALAGALLGGGGGAVKGALGGGAMALLGTLAVSALKNWSGGQAQGQAAAAPAAPAAQAPQISRAEIEQMTSPRTAELCLEAMIAAAKADGSITNDEMQRIVGKLEEGGISEEERQFVVRKMSEPQDVEALAAAVPNREVGAQVYAASLMAIDVDTQAERDHLARLAAGIGLDRQAVARLHQMVGAPAA